MVMRRPYGERKCTENNWVPLAEWEVGKENPGERFWCVCALWVQGLVEVCLGSGFGVVVFHRGFALLNLFLNMSAV